jgi:serine/threonine-protein kinase
MTDLLGRERYRVDRTLGQGAMGAVYLARDTILDRVVAVKVLAAHLAADDAFRRRFVLEARLAARLCHPNVVQVFDAGDDDDGHPYLVMEYVDGVTVADRLARQGGFGADELTALAAQLSDGLAQAHAQGIVHRDVKPHNVLLRRDGVAKLTDFGIARTVEERGLTEIGTVLGTVPYMAPEQAAGRTAGPAADVYGLGALLRHVAAGPLPSDLAALVGAALADDPAARPSAAQIHDRLAALAEAAPVAPTVATAPADAAPTEIRPVPGTATVPAPETGSRPFDIRVPEAWRRFARRPVAAAAAAVVVLLLLILAPNLAGSGRKSVTPSPVAPVPTAADPSQGARAFADWLRGQSPDAQPGR